ncbi:MAG: hypothetical protein NTZ59_03915 [Bacteroidetes bacterium]|nr:hypothetical protein [Bacteroidota bacterium]
MQTNSTQEDKDLVVKYRQTENLHIVFWLFKDLAWCMVWKPLGIAMIFPTLLIAIIITYRSRYIISERYHNLAVTVWIIANSYWMLSEFLHFEDKPLLGYTYKHLATIPFGAGILILAYYYLFFHSKENKKLTEKT